MKFLVCIDGSEHSEKVVEEAIRYAKGTGATITLFYVLEEFLHLPPYAAHFSQESITQITEELMESVMEMMSKWETVIKEEGISAESKIKPTLLSPADIICDYAREREFDLVILGSRGLGGLKKLFLGSVSLKVANQIHTDLLIVK